MSTRTNIIGLAVACLLARGAFAQALDALAFGLRLGRDAYEFLSAVGEGGEIETIGFDDALGLWIAAAVALAGLAVAENENSSLEQRTVQRFDASRGQRQKLGLTRGGRPANRLSARRWPSPRVNCGSRSPPLSPV